ncbi:hypothetical protein NPIL_517641 [Nephila pilipes]|uniref:Uncharacterized protein n=1 Tax=Nephila pilipes TaxID=299642 RepID=A0A8X6QV28_NEPPI|nr:hypothetical protein NPIL_517641 [Nephila pilipes]
MVSRPVRPVSLLFFLHTLGCQGSAHFDLFGAVYWEPTCSITLGPHHGGTPPASILWRSSTFIVLHSQPGLLIIVSSDPCPCTKSAQGTEGAYFIIVCLCGTMQFRGSSRPIQLTIIISDFFSVGVTLSLEAQATSFGLFLNGLFYCNLFFRS